MLIRGLWFLHIWILRFNRQEGPYRAFLPVRPLKETNAMNRRFWLMKRRLVGLLCGFIACLGWHMAQAGAQELEINLPVEFETLQIIMTDEQQTWLAGYTGEPMSSKPAVLQVT